MNKQDIKLAHKLLIEANLDKSYWGVKIIKAEIIGYFTISDLLGSACWFTCACGKLDDHIERDEKDGNPKDNDLNAYGLDFHYSVTRNQFFEAALFLIKIEKRSIKLLRGKA